MKLKGRRFRRWRKFKQNRRPSWTRCEKMTSRNASKVAATLGLLSSLRRGLLWRWCRSLMSKVSFLCFTSSVRKLIDCPSYSVQETKLCTAKWLYFLNGMLYYYNSCHILKPIHQHAVLYFNIGLSILHMLLRPIRHTQHFPLRSQEEQQQINLTLLFWSVKCYWFWLVDFVFGPAKKKLHPLRLRLHWSHLLVLHAQSTYQENGFKSWWGSKYVILNGCIS